MRLLISSFDVKRAFHPAPASRGFASHVFLVLLLFALSCARLLAVYLLVCLFASVLFAVYLFVKGDFHRVGLF